MREFVQVAKVIIVSLATVSLQSNNAADQGKYWP